MSFFKKIKQSVTALFIVSLFATVNAMASPICPLTVYCDQGKCSGTTQNGHAYSGYYDAKQYKNLGHFKSGEMHKAGIECYYEHGRLTVFIKNQHLQPSSPIKIKHDTVTNQATTIQKKKSTAP